MRFPRSSGIVLHPSSLAGPFGIGDLGSEARRFLDFLQAAGQSIWQLLPLGPTGYGDSPYQCFSALAGNPLLISPQDLAGRGWLDPAELAAPPRFPDGSVAFELVIPWKTALLQKAAQTFFEQANAGDRARYNAFCAANAAWLDDFALFMALKRHHGDAVWTAWPADIRGRDPHAIADWRERLAVPLEHQRFLQMVFFDQWNELRAYAKARGIRVMGDLPIYVAHDSADVWANPHYFELAPDGNPAAIAGVPPDYFSSTGQLWGNPIYRWQAMAADGYTWWIDRFQGVLAMVDMVRLDHFRGFEAYWEVPGGHKTAEHGRWVKGPGAALFEALRAALGELPLVAENLGVITPEVEAIRERFDLPGMSILQFAFGNDPQGPSFQPHNYPRSLVAYTGTHDCDTTMGWWESEGRGESTRTAADIARERAFAKEYLATGGAEMNWVLIRAAAASVADTVLIPMQDVLGLGSQARMNQPATLGGNWRWRYLPHSLDPALAARLKRICEIYSR